MEQCGQTGIGTYIRAGDRHLAIPTGFVIMTDHLLPGYEYKVKIQTMTNAIRITVRKTKLPDGAAIAAPGTATENIGKFIDAHLKSTNELKEDRLFVTHLGASLYMPGAGYQAAEYSDIPVRTKPSRTIEFEAKWSPNGKWVTAPQIDESAGKRLRWNRFQKRHRSPDEPPAQGKTFQRATKDKMHERTPIWRRQKRGPVDLATMGFESNESFKQNLSPGGGGGRVVPVSQITQAKLVTAWKNYTGPIEKLSSAGEGTYHTVYKITGALRTYLNQQRIDPNKVLLRVRKDPRSNHRELEAYEKDKRFNASVLKQRQSNPAIDKLYINFTQYKEDSRAMLVEKMLVPHPTTYRLDLDKTTIEKSLMRFLRTAINYSNAQGTGGKYLIGYDIKAANIGFRLTPPHDVVIIDLDSVGFEDLENITAARFRNHQLPGIGAGASHPAVRSSNALLVMISQKDESVQRWLRYQLLYSVYMTLLYFGCWVKDKNSKYLFGAGSHITQLQDMYKEIAAMTDYVDFKDVGRKQHQDALRRAKRTTPLYLYELLVKACNEYLGIDIQPLRDARKVIDGTTEGTEKVFNQTVLAGFVDLAV